MKKSIIISLSLATVLLSCKKEKTNEFTPTDVTGTSIVKGNVSKPVIAPNGSGGFNNNSRVPAQGINVYVKVNKNALYPNSNAVGADVYLGTTDANGNYNVSVKTNASGVNAQITIDGFTATQDTIINGVTKAGLYSSYTGTTTTRTLFMGQNSQLDYAFPVTVVSSNPNTILKIGTAKITGSVGIVQIKEVLTGTVSSFTSTTIPVASRKVMLNFNFDPNTQATKQYEAVTDANGYYNFDVTTVASNTGGFPQDATIWVSDYATTRDTIKANGTVKTGKPGVFKIGGSIIQNSVFNGNIRNAQHLTYNNFIAD